MARVIFLSHAGEDSAQAALVAAGLQSAGIDVRFDRRELRLGDSFLAFMESGLSTSDYCLLLWSARAAKTPWVRLEWEAALYRSIQEKQSFLVAGLLEDVPLPALLAPRLRVDLFPDIQHGLAPIITTWQTDRAVESQTRRQVASAALREPTSTLTDTIYVTSELFGITVPLKVSLDEPAGLCLDRIVDGFRLPKVFDHEGRVGVRFGYQLRHDDTTLNRAGSLASQQVGDKAVLWLETSMTPYSQSNPIAGSLHPTAFRGLDLSSAVEGGATTSRDHGLEKAKVEELARAALTRAVTRSRLAPV